MSLLKYPWVPAFIDFCKITSCHILPKSKMVALACMSYDDCHKVTKTVRVIQLSKHHYQQLVPTGKMLRVFAFFVFHDNPIKSSLRQNRITSKTVCFFDIM